VKGCGQTYTEAMRMPISRATYYNVACIEWEKAAGPR
jgi:hypothetical protein